MTRDEVKALIKEKEEQIIKIQREIRKIKRDFCKSNAPYKVGDDVLINGKQAVVTSVYLVNDKFLCGYSLVVDDEHLSESEYSINEDEFYKIKRL